MYKYTSNGLTALPHSPYKRHNYLHLGSGCIFEKHNKANTKTSDY